MEKEKPYDRHTDYRRQAIRAARDFCYGPDVIDLIKKAKTDDEISEIMRAARHEAMKCRK